MYQDRDNTQETKEDKKGEIVHMFLNKRDSIWLYRLHNSLHQHVVSQAYKYELGSFEVANWPRLHLVD